MKPDFDYVPEFYHGYVALVADLPLIEALTRSKNVCFEFFESIHEDKGNYAYAEGKWSIKELINHIIDAERVFAYRALSFARNDRSVLPGFDENIWTPVSKANSRSLADIVNEYRQVSESTISMFKSFDNEMLNRTGTASNVEFNVANIGFITAGHESHHVSILKERYL